jgi:hypothetical protein
MSLFKWRGRGKVGQIAPLVNHYKIKSTLAHKQSKLKNRTNMATNIVNFKANVLRTLDILPTLKELKTRSLSHA